MEKHVKVVTKDPTVVTEGYLVSLGKERDRWVVSIPREATRIMGKRTRYQVELKPLGSISPVRAYQ